MTKKETKPEETTLGQSFETIGTEALNTILAATGGNAQLTEAVLRNMAVKLQQLVQANQGKQ
jgi:hypothetical protein